MSSPVEDRLREALAEAGASLDPATLRPLRAPERRWRVDYRLLGVAAAAVVVLAGAATAVALGTGGQDDVVAVAPEQSEAAEMAVFLCSKAVTTAPCSGRDATPQQVEGIEAVLRGLPQVNEVSFEDQAAAYERFRKSYAGNTAVLDAVKATDLPPSFHLKIKKGGDREQVTQSLLGLEGLQAIVDRASPDITEMPTADDLKWQISVFLCDEGTRMPTCGAGRDGGKAATAAQKRAIDKLIGAAPQVAEHAFESKEMAYERFKEEFQESNPALVNATKVGDLPEAFRIALKDEMEGGEVVERLKRQPGVATVVYQACVPARRTLSIDFGLDLPASTMCPGAG
ncbi:permease-like cell division protein FtsX [Nonomuraea sp. NPDC004580]|uniref:permease-like cell division protein FtsX n=1 Tax=Nonomuraea sp. NPDC004580 TaxID=3154552 RepID=UPI0033AE3021